MLAVGAALAVLGPYGSFAMGPLATRLAYWIPAALGGYLIVRPTVIVAARAAERLDLPPTAGLAAGVLVAAAPMTLFIWWLNGRGFADFPTLEGWLQLYAQIAIIGAVVTLLFFLLERTPATSEGTVEAKPATVHPSLSAPNSADPSPTSEPAFLARLPPHLRGDLLALEMEDHYVRAHAPGGSALILLRLRDAVAELDGVEGLRVHRSWWVARDAVESVAQDGRNVRLKLRGGLEAPVARASVSVLRAAGWL